MLKCHLENVELLHFSPKRSFSQELHQEHMLGGGVTSNCRVSSLEELPFCGRWVYGSRREKFKQELLFIFSQAKLLTGGDSTWPSLQLPDLVCLL